MHRLRAWIRSFFGFSRTETNAVFILLPLMTILVFSEPIYEYWFVRRPLDFSKEERELDSLIATWRWNEADSAGVASPALAFFVFDPNKATEEELLRLGFEKTIARRLIKYRSSGGTFRVKGDLLKIHGMDSGHYRALFAYVDLPEQRASRREEKKVASQRPRQIEKFDINEADTTQLKKIYGIGPKLSNRIVQYREKLGGFISLQQLYEVYGLDSGVVRDLSTRAFVKEHFVPRQLDPNQSTEAQLAAHPYIRFKLAKAIVTYRFQHGPYRSLEDLQRIVLTDDRVLQKIKPYLSVNP